MSGEEPVKHLCFHPLAKPLSFAVKDGEDLVLPRAHVCVCEVAQDHGYEDGPIGRMFYGEGLEWLS